MLKRDEIEDLESCFNKAQEGERLFVLLARDPAAPVAIRAWIAERIRLGKNAPGDEQIREAFECATLMEMGRSEIAVQRQPRAPRGSEGGGDAASPADQEGAVAGMDPPTFARRVDQLMRINAQMFEGTVRVLGQLNTNLYDQLSGLTAENARLRRELEAGQAVQKGATT